jgi:polyketide cyclase/dehydrase/lipid transport protein
MLDLLIAVFALGLGISARTRSAVFKTTPEQLFALIDGPQTWRSNVKKYDPVSSPDGRRQWRETDNHGKIITYEAVERDPPTLLKTRIVNGNLPYSGTWTLNLELGDGLAQCATPSLRNKRTTSKRC